MVLIRLSETGHLWCCKEIASRPASHFAASPTAFLQPEKANFLILLWL